LARLSPHPALAEDANTYLAPEEHSGVQMARRGPRKRYAAPAAPVTPPQQPAPAAFTPEEPAQPRLAHSENTEKELTFDQALKRIKSGNHQAFKNITTNLLTQVGLNGHVTSAVGDWEDGAEQSLLTLLKDPTDEDTLRYVGAWYGLLGNQRAVLVFHPQRQGLDSVYTINVPDTNLASVRQQLSQAGIPFRTLVPQKKGTQVVIYDEKRALRDRVAQFAGAHNADIHEALGRGEFLGDSTRAGARAAYRKLIDAYESSGAPGRRPVRPGQTQEPDRSGSPSAPVRARRRGRVTRLQAGHYTPTPDDSAPGDWKHDLDRRISALLSDQALPLGLKYDILQARERQDWSRLSALLSRLGGRVQYSGINAPAGGVVVRGMFYQGGHYIPKDELEKSGWHQYQQVQALRAKKYARADGSYRPMTQDEIDSREAGKRINEEFEKTLADWQAAARAATQRYLSPKAAGGEESKSEDKE
jgi:hypothetical protein